MKKRLLALILVLVMALGTIPVPAQADGTSDQTFNGHSAEEFVVTYLGEVPTYNGSAQEPVPVVSCQNETLVEGQDYTVSYENNINATDEAWIIITGCGSYDGLLLRQAFTITPYDLDNYNSLQLITTVPYSVPLQYTKPIVDENGNELVEGVDYLLRHECILEGDEWTRIYVYGIGNYTGSADSVITLSYNDDGSDEETPEGETLRVYPKNEEQEHFMIFSSDSILCLIQTEESKYFIPEYYLYEFVDGDPDNMKLVAEKTYLSADVNTTNKFEYQFNSSGIYGLAVVWAEYTKSSYVDSNGQVIYTQEPNGIVGSYSAVIEVIGYDDGDNGGGTGIGATRYDWIESVEPAITYAGPRRVLLEVLTTPYVPIVADSYSISFSGTQPASNYGYLYLKDAGVYTIQAKINRNSNGTYVHTATWTLEVPEWDITDGGRIEAYDPENNIVQVTFGGEKLVADTDYTTSVMELEDTGLTKVSVVCKNLFAGTLTKLYYSDTGNPYYCAHTFEAAVTEPTCTEGGYTTYTCTFCGHNYKDDRTEAQGHSWKGTECTNCDAVRENPFTDVPEGAWYYDPVLWAVEKGITTGADATTFNPNGDCLRAQVVTFLWRAEGCPEPKSTANPFTDVTESDWYYKAVLWAVEKGITNGTSDTTFGPTAKCNRAQTVTFLWRAMGQPAVSSTANPFSDVPANVWYTAPILWAVEEGITNGMGDGTFGVNGICNRAQVVTFLYRAYN